MSKKYSINFNLNQNYPNPFNSETMITYSIDKVDEVVLKIYDLNGKEVETLIDEFQSPGEYRIKFKANNYPSGLYFCRLKIGDSFQTKKLILQK